MNYFLVAGEASGDLHASNLMREIQKIDAEADFRFFGGDEMASVGGVLLKHYREMAFMGIVDVVLHAKTILKNLKCCKQAIKQWKPDALILVDYASFNLKIAANIKHSNPEIPIHFYISPKLWAWKEYRIRSFRKYIDHLYVILPFETDFFAKHHFPVEYVGNPSVDSVAKFLETPFDADAFRALHALDDRSILAILPGSRTSEIKRNLPIMLKVASNYPHLQVVIAGAPGQELACYAPFLSKDVKLIFGETYSILHLAKAAVVTSGTATLETALLNTPQVVCYAVSGGVIPNWVFKHFMHVDHFSLVNLIAGKSVVHELLGKNFTEIKLEEALRPLLENGEETLRMLTAYQALRAVLGSSGTAARAATSIVEKLNKNPLHVN